MRIYYISFMDGFSVEPIAGGIWDRPGAKGYRRLAESIEIQLNRGSNFLQAYNLYIEQNRPPSLQENVRNTVLNLINAHAFSVSLRDFSCNE